MAVVALLAAGGLAAPASAAPAPVVFGTAAASPKTQTTKCPATVKLSTAAKVKAPATLKYQWVFSNGDKSSVKTYRVGGKGIKNVRLHTAIKVGGDARGWGAVRLLSPVKKVSKKAYFAVTCTGGGDNGGGTGHATSGGWVHLSYGHVEEPPANPGNGGTPPPAEQNHVKAVTLRLGAGGEEKADRCPKEFALAASFDITGAPATAFTINYRLLASDGTVGAWASTSVPANHGTTHEVDLGKISVSQSGWRQIEVAQPNALKSNQAAYTVECAQPSITLSKPAGKPGETVKVTVKGIDVNVKSITSNAFEPAVHTVAGSHKEYSFDAKVAVQAGAHEVKAVFADNTSVTATFTVEVDVNPIKSLSIAVDPVKYTGRCPKPLAVTGTFDVSGLPAVESTVQYRRVGTEEWQSLTVPANHGATFVAQLKPLTVQATEKGTVKIEVSQQNKLVSNEVAYDITCVGPTISLEPDTVRPGEHVTVTVDGVDSEVKKIESSAFRDSDFRGETRVVYRVGVSLDARSGEHTVTARLANGEVLTAKLSVYRSPVRSLSVVAEPAPSGTPVACPHRVNYKVTFNLAGAPAGALKIKFRVAIFPVDLVTPFRDLTIPAGHGDSYTAVIDSEDFYSTTQHEQYRRVEVPEFLGAELSNALKFKITCK
ncbi:hypothetical protein ACIBG7_02350 [Nonomuraea sp. NPDC050328]|uniref:hypothetical protein n=1 Tax=Nonomuraea sp. NPDC050328 TaxID=3364361 RepID=UPI0037904352